jgi:carbamoyl-phosphate synthase large subunit
MTPSIRVLITGVSGGSIGEQVYKALRQGRHRYDIVATNVSLTPMAVVQAEHYETLPAASSEDYPDGLLSVVRKYGVEFLVPGSGSELIRISQGRETLASTGVRLLINADSVIATCVDKVRAMQFLNSRGFRVPATFEVSHPAELEGRATRFPYIVKPGRGSGSAGAFIAQDDVELRFFVEYLRREGHVPVVQEYVGRVDGEYTVGVLHTPNRELIGSVVLHRQILSGLSNRLRVSNRTGRRELGEVLAISSGISQGRIGEVPPVRRQAEAMAEALGSAGPLNIQGRWDGEEFVPFEINPRFSGTSPMRAMAGFNEPELLIDCHLGQGSGAVPPLRYGEFTRGVVEYFVEASENEL